MEYYSKAIQKEYPETMDYQRWRQGETRTPMKIDPQRQEEPQKKFWKLTERASKLFDAMEGGTLTPEEAQKYWQGLTSLQFDKSENTKRS